MHLYYSECENIYLKQYFITVSLNSEFENRKYKLNTEKNLFASTFFFIILKIERRKKSAVFSVVTLATAT